MRKFVASVHTNCWIFLILLSFRTWSIRLIYALLSPYCVFSHDVMAAIFVSQNNETAAMFVSQTSPMGVELFSYENAFFCSHKSA